MNNQKLFILRPAESKDTDYVNIISGNGCSSLVGRWPGGQDLTLGDGCFSEDTIVHEFIHAIGFYHEHARSDFSIKLTSSFD